jgi:hypothetical protein
MGGRLVRPLFIQLFNYSVDFEVKENDFIEI